MTREAVLDASALIALLWEEQGSRQVEPLLGRAVISAVNLAEVLQRFALHQLPVAGKRERIESLGVRIEPFVAEDAEVAAILRTATRSAGLSLADRACLALARRLAASAHTADRAWHALDVDVEVVLIR